MQERDVAFKEWQAKAHAYLQAADAYDLPYGETPRYSADEVESLRAEMDAAREAFKKADREWLNLR